MINLSIIIPLFKGNRYCQNILNMIEANVTYKNFYLVCDVEVIFVNDYPCEEIVLSNQCYKYSIKIINQPQNRGIHASRIEGLKAAKGQYIIMLDQDDLVKKNWLYSQWNKIIAEKAEYCVCNGWKGRFQILWKYNFMEKNINDIQKYLFWMNPITSPGQVIIKKDAIPHKWAMCIQKHNGSDDFLLWIMALKEGHSFILNDDYIFYHTPERTIDSISLVQMMESNRETMEILSNFGFLSFEEKNIFEQFLKKREVSVDIKYYKMFRTLYNWIKLKNRNILINEYLQRKGWKQIAIYGMGYIGECLYEELEKTDIMVLYGIDQSARDYKGEICIYRIDEQLEDVDAVIVTFEGEFEIIKKSVHNKIECPIVTIDELLINMEQNYNILWKDSKNI